MVLPRHRPILDNHEVGEHSVVRYQLAVLALLERYSEPEPWWAEARCHGEGTDRFFPPLDRQAGRVTPDVREFCGQCPVQVECREAGEDMLAGIWAGQLRRTSSRSVSPTSRRPGDPRRRR